MDDFQIVSLEGTDVGGWDFDQLKTVLQKELEDYRGLVYTVEMRKDAKSDRAKLNKAKKVIEDAGKEYKNKCLEPYKALEPKLKELAGMIKNQSEEIDRIVKELESRQKEKKELEIRNYYDQKAKCLGNLAGLLYPKLFDPRWANATTKKKKYEEEILEAINRAGDEIAEIKAWQSPFADKLLQIYAETFSVEQVKEKQKEWENICGKAGGPGQAEGHMAAAPIILKTRRTPEDGGSDGVMMKIYASEYQRKLICDFMKAIGADYELF